MAHFGFFLYKSLQKLLVEWSTSFFLHKNNLEICNVEISSINGIKMLSLKYIHITYTYISLGKLLQLILHHSNSGWIHSMEIQTPNISLKTGF